MGLDFESDSQFAMPLAGRTVPNRTGGRILIVEDQGIVATDIERCLEDSGFEVTAISTSMESAIREASACRPDLVLMDIRIRGEADGIDAADHLRRTFGTPIVYLTAHDDGDTMARARRTQPMAFLIKPFKPAELISTVEIALDRSRTEHQAQERERSFLSAMDTIGDAVLTGDSQGCVRFMNRAAEELTGWRQVSALGRKITDIVNVVTERESDAADFCALLHGDDPRSAFEHEFRIRGRDGVCRWLATKSTCIAGAGDIPIRVVVMQDVTRRKQNEQELRRQAGLLDQSQDAIITWESDRAVSYWNRGAEALYGFTSREALGHFVSELLPAGDHTYEDMESALERDGHWSGELRRQNKDGREIVVESRLVVVRDGTGRNTVLETDRDITERRVAELEIRRLNQELRTRVSELTTLNQELESFNYTISHDLRAPLRHIDGYSRILLEISGDTVNGESRAYLNRVRDGARRMGQMVDELLELSRTSRQEPMRQSAELKSLLEDALFELKPDVHDRDIEWRIGDLPVVYCDPILMRQVFTNLLANAVKFTRHQQPAVIQVGHTVSGEEHVLFVRDNGVGFSMKYAHKLFGVFQRLHRREDFEGTGIGLVTVQRIIQKHGGRVWAEGAIDQGATFYFTLGPQRVFDTETSADLAGAR